MRIIVLMRAAIWSLLLLRFHVWKVFKKLHELWGIVSLVHRTPVTPTLEEGVDGISRGDGRWCPVEPEPGWTRRWMFNHIGREVIYRYAWRRLMVMQTR